MLPALDFFCFKEMTPPSRSTFRRDLCNSLEPLHVTQTSWPPATTPLAGFSHAQNSRIKKTTEQSLKESASCLPYGAPANYTDHACKYAHVVHMHADHNCSCLCAAVHDNTRYLCKDTHYLQACLCSIPTRPSACHHAPLIPLNMPCTSTGFISGISVSVSLPSTFIKLPLLSAGFTAARRESRSSGPLHNQLPPLLLFLPLFLHQHGARNTALLCSGCQETAPGFQKGQQDSHP